ncbi:crossover junction endodeoxyribonuclease RuvC [Candidatus Dependentiae bacterium]|nr:MAG: crossover junction endodeoxyribonuclease RuvC [Candidatus Dependentiae bacterium]
MKILGIDPGTRVAGFCIMQVQANGSILLLEAGCLLLSEKDTMQRRLRNIYDFFDTLLKSQNIQSIALETPFLGKNAHNFLKLGYVRAIIYLLSDIHTVGLHEYAPREVKKALTGSGSAEKDQVGRVVRALFPQIATKKIRDDVTDAIAISFCGALRQKGGHF